MLERRNLRIVAFTVWFTVPLVRLHRNWIKTSIPWSLFLSCWLHSVLVEHQISVVLTIHQGLITEIFTTLVGILSHISLQKSTTLVEDMVTTLREKRQ